MPPRPDEERELQELLRGVAAVVIIGLLALIVVATVIAPFISERAADTTLILGLTASLVGALLALLGVQVAITRRNGEK